MRPPEFTGGNEPTSSTWTVELPQQASMRPPEFTGGNIEEGHALLRTGATSRFNEAAGIHRRKLYRPGSNDYIYVIGPWNGFNEAAGIHRRKLRLFDERMYYITVT